MITKMTEHYILCGDIQIPTEKKQFSIEMISKIRELYILYRDIQVATEKKQFSIEMISKMTEPCILCGDIQIPTEKSVQHRNDFKDQRTLHSLLGHSNPN